MADQAKPIITKQGVGGTNKVTGYRGSRAGEAFEGDDEAAKKKQEETDWADYAKEQKLDPMMFSGLGGGATRSKHKPQFDAWRVKRLKGASLGELMGGGQ